MRNIYKKGSFSSAWLCAAMAVLLTLLFVTDAASGRLAVQLLPIIAVALCASAYSFWKAWAFRKTCAEIMEHGVCRTGKVLDWERSIRTGGTASAGYRFLVAYDSPQQGRHVLFWTPYTTIKPGADAALRCSVYEYHGKAVAAEFQPVSE